LRKADLGSPTSRFAWLTHGKTSKTATLSINNSTTKKRLSEETYRGGPDRNNAKNLTQQSELKSDQDIKSCLKNSHLPWFCAGYCVEPAAQSHAIIIQLTDGTSYLLLFHNQHYEIEKKKK
jgi:hypothetical protein